MTPQVIVWGSKRSRYPMPFSAATQVGTKAVGLYTLHRWGFPVPPGFAMSRMIDDYTLSNHAVALRGFCLSRSIDSIQVAVRSSPSVSMPGMLSTVLNVPLLQNSDSPVGALRKNIKAVFMSWLSVKAIEYRDTFGIPHYPPRIGCIVQVMVNPTDGGCSGIMFTHNPITKTRRTMGEIIISDYGEGLVGGTVKPTKLRWVREYHPKAYKRLLNYGTKLFKLTGKPQDVEFVITKESKLYLVQTRDMKFSTEEQYGSAITEEGDQILKGFPGCQGLVEGTIVTTELDMTALPKPHILYRDMTTTDDFGIMKMADAFVTSMGGPTCHAAIVARSMNKPCVVGLQTSLFPGTKVCVDGKAGIVYKRVK